MTISGLKAAEIGRKEVINYLKKIQPVRKK